MHNFVHKFVFLCNSHETPRQTLYKPPAVFPLYFYINLSSCKLLIQELHQTQNFTMNYAN